MPQEQTRIVIVGAGFSGLATAYELQSRLPEAEITLLEMQQRAGGMLWSERVDDYLAEVGPVSFPGNRLGVMKLCHRLKLTNQLIAPGPAFRKRLILHHDGVIKLIPTTLGKAMTSPLFGMGSAFRLLTERLRFSGAKKNKHNESIYQFIERRVGTELAVLLADALGTDQFAGDGRAISVCTGFPQLARAEQQFGNVLGGYPRLVQAEREAAAKASIELTDDWMGHFTFKNGMRTLIDTLRAQLKQSPRLGVGVQSIVQAADGLPHRWLVRCSDGETRPADVVLLACPAPKQAAILADMDADLADTIMSIPHADVISLAMGYRSDQVPGYVDSHSVLVPQRFKRDVMKVVFPSSYFPGRAGEGDVLLQLTMGGWQRKEMLSWEDDALIIAARRELRNLLKIVRPPQYVHLTRWPKAIPQYTLGHGLRVSKIEEQCKKHRGLYLGGNAYHGITIVPCRRSDWQDWCGMM
ncbi:MAG TPA: protoporphyrinogen oxidase [Gemmatales bacterium]|nr:protoporphyrinogen oxidase [Gemmatales bacterium]